MQQPQSTCTSRARTIRSIGSNLLMILEQETRGTVSNPGNRTQARRHISTESICGTIRSRVHFRKREDICKDIYARLHACDKAEKRKTFVDTVEAGNSTHINSVKMYMLPVPEAKNKGQMKTANSSLVLPFRVVNGIIEGKEGQMKAATKANQHRFRVVRCCRF
jgi:hypothetical protein